MEAVATKEDLLKSHGYRYNFDMMHYVNRKTRRVFSLEYVEDHDAADLERLIMSELSGSGWQFIFNDAPSESTRRLLEQYYEKGVR